MPTLKSCVLALSLAGWSALPGLSAAQTSAATSSNPSTADADALGFGGASTGSSAPDSDATGFGDVPDAVRGAGESTPSANAADTEPSPFRLSATLQVQSALRVQQATPSRLAKLRQVLEARLEWKQSLGAAELRACAGVRTEADFAYLRDRDAYDRAVFDSYAWQLLPGESYLAFNWSALELRVGEQIANFGQGEMLSLLDVLNPRDLREPLLADVAELRMPVLMTRLGLSFEPLRIEIALVHEPYFGLLPPPLGEFSPFRKRLLETPAFATLTQHTLSNDALPRRTLADLGATQPYARLSLSLGSLDLSLLVGSALDGLGVPSLPEPAAFAHDPVALPLLHPRYELVGQAGAYAFGPLVLRWEALFEHARAFAIEQRDSALPSWQAARSNAVAGLLGLTYVPFVTTSAALELTARRLFDNPARSPALQDRPRFAPLFPIEAPQLALRFNQRFLRERASLGLLALVIGFAPLNAWVVRAELGYALSDRVQLSLGYLSYQPSRRFGPFYGLGQHDRVFLNVRWDV